MSRIANQAYLNTRVSVMLERLFTPEQDAALVNMTFPVLAERFGLTAFIEESTNPAACSRAIEQSLLQVLLADLQILIRPLDGLGRELFLAWGRKYALFNFKALIRGRIYNLDPHEIRAQLFDLPALLRLSSQEFFRAENVQELLRLLESGPCRQVALHAREIYEHHQEPFALEAAFEQRYYSVLVQKTIGFKGEHLNSLHRLLGTLLDQMALLWLLRFRFLYHFPPSETFYRLVPSPHLLKYETLLHLVELDSLEQVLNNLPKSLMSLLANSSSILEVQQRMERYVRAEVNRILKHSTSAVARALAYLILRESDLRRLFSVIQGRLLKFDNYTISTALALNEVPASR